MTILLIRHHREGACDSSTGKLLRANAEFFQVEMGIPFFLTNTKYDEKSYGYYMPSGWYKNLWKFMSTPIFDLDVTEDYLDIPIICEKDAYLIEAFVNGGFRNADLKALNFFQKFLQAVTLSDIATADGHRISHYSYEGLEGNGLRKDLVWPKVPTKDQMPQSFTTLWKSALNKSFI